MCTYTRPETVQGYVATTTAYEIPNEEMLLTGTASVGARLDVGGAGAVRPRWFRCREVRHHMQQYVAGSVDAVAQQRSTAI
jgi:hypothetical protein